MKKRKAIKRFAMPKTCKGMLKIIDAFLLSGGWDSEAGKLWHVLGAIRGPDHDPYSGHTERVKRATTGLIRYAAFGDGASYHGAVVTRRDNDEYLDLRNNLRDKYGDHFGAHTESAFRALGLDYRKINK